MFKLSVKLQQNLPIKTMKKSSMIALAAVFGLTFAALAQDATLPPASTKTGVTYATDIKPIFDASCIRCHGDKKPGNGIVLTSLETTLKGGKDGKILTPGDSTKGDLIMSVAHIGDPQSFMPRGRKATPLTPEQVGLIRAWIDQGAK
jgi:mono/diheme cytochrome c family protein